MSPLEPGLRERFNEAAELYDRARPVYPPGLVSDLATACELSAASRVLEIGPGTGQLTAALAEYGSTIIAIELGAELAAVARRKLSRFPNVEVVTAPFEQWALPVGPFDVVVAATAFHWLDPAVRVPKAAHALRPGGNLAVITTSHVSGGTTEFFEQAQRCYESWDPGTSPGQRLPDPVTLPFEHYELDEATEFGSATFRSYLREVVYTAEDYIDTLLTYSGHRALPPKRRHALLGCLRQLINDRYEGQIVKRYRHDLVHARRLDPTQARSGEA
jgi:protein-L-isoaspartate O-methyltransferase